MEPFSTIILSGIVYDMMKNTVVLSAANLKKNLTDWLVDDVVAQKLEMQLSNLHLNDDMSEKAITSTLESSKLLMDMLSDIKAIKSASINQVHHGIGNNNATINNH